MPAVQTIKGDQVITSSLAIGHPLGYVFQHDGLNALDLSGSLIIRTSGSVPVSPTGSVSMYFDKTTRKWMASEDGGAYVNVIGSAVGAPTDVPYVTLAANATLTNERVLTGTANQITITDGGIGNAVTLSLPQDINTFSTPTFGNLNVASVLTSSQVALRTLGVGATNNINIPGTDAQVIQLVAGSDFTKGAGFLIGGRNATAGLVNKGSIITNIGNLDGTNFFSIQSNDFTASTNNIFYVNGGSQNTYMAAEGGGIGKVSIGIDPFAGVTLNSAFDLSGAVTFREMFTPPSVAPSHTSLIYYDQATNKTKISENGGAFVNLVGSSGLTSSAGINSGSGQGIYKGNSDAGTLQFRTLQAGQGINLISGSEQLTIVDTTWVQTGSLMNAFSATKVAVWQNPVLTDMSGSMNVSGTLYVKGTSTTFIDAISQIVDNGNIVGANAHIGAAGDSQVLQLGGGASQAQGASIQIGGRNAVGNTIISKGSIGLTIGSTDLANFVYIGHQGLGSGSSYQQLALIRGGTGHIYLNPFIGGTAFGVSTFIGSNPSSIIDMSGAFTARDMVVAPSNAPSNNGRFYFDRNTQRFLVSENAGSYATAFAAGGVSGSVQFNNVSYTSGSARVAIENTGNLFLKDNTFEPWPANLSGSVLYMKFRAGRRMLAVNDQTRWDYSLQPSLATNKVNLWTAWGNTVQTSSFGFNMITTGTMTTRNVLSTNMLTSVRRLGFQTNAAVSASAGIRHSQLQFWRGNQPILGGFYYLARYGIGSGSQGAIPHFIGLTGSTIMPIAGSNPSQLFNLIGLGADVGDNTLSVFSANSTTRTKINLGSSFPCSAPFNSDLYELRLYSPPSGSSIFYSVERINNGVFVEGQLDDTTSTIPNNTTFLAPIAWIATTSASVASIDIVSKYLETDN